MLIKKDKGLKMSDTLPTSVEPCPIIEAVAEVIFDRNLEIEPSAVYGKVYDELKSRYSITENMPISQLPEAIRMQDENLKNKPWYKFSNENYSVMVGANVFAIAVSEPYKGWLNFKHEIQTVINIFSKAGITDSISRIGLKYIDLFAFPIINGIDMHIKSDLAINNEQEIQIRTSLPEKNDLSAVIGLLNNVSIVYKGESKEKISMLDIDIYKKYEIQNSCKLEEVEDLFEKAHLYQKELFFKLASIEFLTSHGYTVK
jgi:uncharacterized protein (TIGR04255 family)